MDNPKRLIDDHLDGELTSEEFRQLGDWLRERDDHAREFAFAWLLHSLLHDCISQRRVQADALLRAITASRAGRVKTADQVRVTSDILASPSSTARASGQSQSRTTRVATYIRQRLALAAACISLAAVALTYFSMRPSDVAMLTQTSNSRWESADQPISEGTLFKEGDKLRLVEGHALVTFGSGAKVVLQGPTVLTIDSESSATLDSGTVTANVPRQAVGFEITTPVAQLVDLGTEFTARVHAGNSLELQVFSGLVELRLVGGKDENEDGPLRLSEGVAIKVDARSLDVETIKYDAKQRITLP